MDIEINAKAKVTSVDTSAINGKSLPGLTATISEIELGKGTKPIEVQANITGFSGVPASVDLKANITEITGVKELSGVTAKIAKVDLGHNTKSQITVNNAYVKDLKGANTIFDATAVIAKFTGLKEIDGVTANVAGFNVGAGAFDSLTTALQPAIADAVNGALNRAFTNVSADSATSIANSFAPALSQALSQELGKAFTQSINWDTESIAKSISGLKLPALEVDLKVKGTSFDQIQKDVANLQTQLRNLVGGKALGATMAPTGAALAETAVTATAKYSKSPLAQAKKYLIAQGIDPDVAKRATTGGKLYSGQTASNLISLSNVTTDMRNGELNRVVMEGNDALGNRVRIISRLDEESGEFVRSQEQITASFMSAQKAEKLQVAQLKAIETAQRNVQKSEDAAADLRGQRAFQVQRDVIKQRKLIDAYQNNPNDFNRYNMESGQRGLEQTVKTLTQEQKTADSVTKAYGKQQSALSELRVLMKSSTMTKDGAQAVKEEYHKAQVAAREYLRTDGATGEKAFNNAVASAKAAIKEQVAIYTKAQADVTALQEKVSNGQAITKFAQRTANGEAGSATAEQVTALTNAWEAADAAVKKYQADTTDLNKQAAESAIKSAEDITKAMHEGAVAQQKEAVKQQAAAVKEQETIAKRASVLEDSAASGRARTEYAFNSALQGAVTTDEIYATIDAWAAADDAVQKYKADATDANHEAAESAIKSAEDITNTIQETAMGRQTASEKQANIDTLKEQYNNQLASLGQSVKAAFDAGQIDTKGLQQYSQMLEEIQAKVNALNATSTDALQTRIGTDLARAERSFENTKINQQTDRDAKYAALESKIDQAVQRAEAAQSKLASSADADVQAKAQAVTAAIADLQNAYQALSGTPITTTNLDELNAKLGAVTTATAEADAAYKTMQQAMASQKLDVDVTAAIAKIQSLRREYTKLSEADKLRLNGIEEQFANVKGTGDRSAFAMANAQLRAFQADMKAVGKAANPLAGMFQGAGRNLMMMVGMGSGIMMLRRELSNMAKAVKEIDTAMMSLKQVSDESASSYEGFLKDAGKRSIDLGVNIKDYIDAATGFNRLGESFKDSQILGEVALKFKNVGAEINTVDDASSILISTMKAFNKEASEAAEISDKINYVGNNFAITSGGVGDILTRAGASMSAANTSFEKTVALGTAGNTIVQNSQKIGTALSTMSMRIRGSTADLSAAGEEIDEYCKSTSKLQAKVKALSGVDIMATPTQYKDVYDILDEISQVWDTMTDINRASLLEAMFGVRNANVGTAILSNFEIARDVLRELTDGSSVNYTETKYGTYLDSITAKANQMQAAFQNFSQQTLNKDILGFAYDAGTGILGFLTQVTSVLNSIPGAATAAALALSKITGTSVLSMSGKSLFGINNNAQSLFSFGSTGGIIKTAQQRSNYAEQLYNAGAERVKDWNDLPVEQRDVEGLAAAWQNVAKQQQISETNMQAVRAQINASVASAHTLGSVFKSVGASIGTMAMNMGAMILVSAAISGIVTLISNQVHAQERAIETANEIKQSWKDLEDQTKKVNQTVDKYADTVVSLQSGVDQATGENISLSTDELEEYHTAANAIADVFPNLVAGWDSVGNAILRNIQNVEELKTMAEQIAFDNRATELAGADQVMKGAYAKYNGVPNVGDTQQLTNLANAIARLIVPESEKDWISDQEYIKAINDFNDWWTQGGSTQFSPQMYNLFTPILSSLKEGVNTLSRGGQLIDDWRQNIYDSYYGGINGFIRDYSAYSASQNTDAAAASADFRTIMRSYVANQFSSVNSNANAWGKTITDTATQAFISNWLGTQQAAFYEQWRDAADPYAQMAADVDALVMSLFGSDSPINAAAQNLQQTSAAFVRGRNVEEGTAITTVGDLTKQQTALEAALRGNEYLVTQDAEGKQILNDLGKSLLTFALGGKTWESIEAQVNHLDEIVSDRDRSNEQDDKDFFNNLNATQLAFAQTLSSTERMTQAEFDQQFATWIETNRLSLETLASTWEQTSKDQESALKALQAQEKNGGVLTASTYGELIQANPKYAQALSMGANGYEINAQELQAIMRTERNELIELNNAGIEAKQEELKLAQQELAKSKEGSKERLTAQQKVNQLQEELVKRQLMNQDLAFQNSAYGRWIAAQGGGETGDDFRAIKSAIDAIKAGEKSGRTNTNAYQTSAELIYGEGWEELTQQQRQQRFKNASALYDKDGQLKIDEFRRQAIASGIMDKSGQFNMDMSIENMAAQMGYGTQFFVQALQAAREYDRSHNLDALFEKVDLSQYMPEETVTETAANTDAIGSNTAAVESLTSAVNANTAALTGGGEGGEGGAGGEGGGEGGQGNTKSDKAYNAANAIAEARAQNEARILAAQQKAAREAAAKAAAGYHEQAAAAEEAARAGAFATAEQKFFDSKQQQFIEASTADEIVEAASGWFVDVGASAEDVLGAINAIADPKNWGTFEEGSIPTDLSSLAMKRALLEQSLAESIKAAADTASEEIKEEAKTEESKEPEESEKPDFWKNAFGMSGKELADSWNSLWHPSEKAEPEKPKSESPSVDLNRNAGFIDPFTGAFHPIVPVTDSQQNTDQSNAEIGEAIGNVVAEAIVQKEEQKSEPQDKEGNISEWSDTVKGNRPEDLYIPQDYRGNVDLLHRPVVDTGYLNRAGWDAEGDYATLFSTQYRGEVNGKAVAAALTPIEAFSDGSFNVLSPEALEGYWDALCDAANKGGITIEEADAGGDAWEGGRGLLLGSKRGDLGTEADLGAMLDQWENQLHLMQAAWDKQRGVVDENGWPYMPEEGEDGFKDIISEYDGEPITVPVDADTTALENSIQSATEQLGVIIFDDEPIQAVKSEIEAGAEMPVDVGYHDPGFEVPHPTMTVDVEYNDPGFTPNAQNTAGAGSPPGFASGTESAPAGNALVGELGPEIIVDKKTGTWRLASVPQLTKLNKGDIVFNANQTRKILAGRRGNGTGTSSTSLTGGKSYAYALTDRWITSSPKPDIEEIVKSTVDKIASIDATTSKRRNGGGGGGGGGGGKSLSDILKEMQDLVDWIPRALEAAKEATERIIDVAADQISYISKNHVLENAIDSVIKEQQLTQQAIDRYENHLEWTQNQLDLSGDIVSKIRNGTIDIQMYDEDTRKKISEYQKWWEKAHALEDTLEKLKDQERELALQKLDVITEYYDDRTRYFENVVKTNKSLLSDLQAQGRELFDRDYQVSLDATAQDRQLLIDERAALQEEFSHLVDLGYLVEGSQDWYKYTKAMQDLDAAIYDADVDLIDLKDEIARLSVTKLQYALARLGETQERINDLMSLHDAQGGVENIEEYYVDLIKNGWEQIDNLERQNELLVQQQAGLEENSEKWQDLQDEIDKNVESIWSMKNNQEQWNDAIADLRVDRLEKQRKELEKQNDAYERELEMQQALEDLEKARSQRTKLIYREGIGFQYEADQEAIRKAEENLEKAQHKELLDKIDDAIEAIQENKQDDNVYNYEGDQVLKQFASGGVADFSGKARLDGSPTRSEVVFNSGDAQKLYNLVHNTADLSSFITDSILRSIGLPGVNGVGDVDNSKSIALNIGDIYVSGVNNSGDLARQIITSLPNQVLQELNKTA